MQHTTAKGHESTSPTQRLRSLSKEITTRAKKLLRFRPKVEVYSFKPKTPLREGSTRMSGELRSERVPFHELHAVVTPLLQQDGRSRRNTKEGADDRGPALVLGVISDAPTPPPPWSAATAALPPPRRMRVAEAISKRVSDWGAALQVARPLESSKALDLPDSPNGTADDAAMRASCMQTGSACRCSPPPPLRIQTSQPVNVSTELTLRDGDKLGLDPLTGELIVVPPDTSSGGSAADKDGAADSNSKGGQKPRSLDEQFAEQAPAAVVSVRFHGSRFWIHRS